MKSFINIHVFVEVSSVNEAKDIGSKLSESLKYFGHARICNVKQYWKIPEYFEFSIELANKEFCEDDCRKVADVLGNEWSQVGGGLVWSSQPDSILVDPKVKWANLEFIEMA